MHLPHPLPSPHLLVVLVRVGLLALCGAANLYYLFSIFAAKDFFRRSVPVDRSFHPPLSVLKPIRGLDPDAARNFSSFCRQDYPDYELIFGVKDADDPAVGAVRETIRAFPERRIRLVIGGLPAGANPKVNTLMSMLPEARHPLLLVSDADIRVGPDHLRSMVQPLKDAGVGVVTCLYRSEGRGFAGRIDALGLSAEFQPSVLVARKVEGIRFAMGSGILIRRGTLEAIGGLAAVADYLADDYLLGCLPTRMGWRVEFAREVVDHSLATRRFLDLARHQFRWNRGIRVSRPWGYAGLAFTHGTAASLLLVAIGTPSVLGWSVCAVTVSLRLLMAWIVAGRFLNDAEVRRSLWLVPVRDLVSFFFWVFGFLGNTIEWRGQRFRLETDGKIVPLESGGGLAAAPSEPHA